MMDLMVTLRGIGGECRIPSPWMVGLFNLAMQYGWQPRQNSQSDKDEHCCELVFDRLTDADARSLAEALEQALPDVPRHDALRDHPRRTLRWDSRSVWGPYLSMPPTVYEWFSGANRRMIEEVIALARQGSFQVLDPTV